MRFDDVVHFGSASICETVSTHEAGHDVFTWDFFSFAKEEEKVEEKIQRERERSTASHSLLEIFLHRRYRRDCIDPYESRKWRIPPIQRWNKMEPDNPRGSQGKETTGVFLGLRRPGGLRPFSFLSGNSQGYQ